MQINRGKHLTRWEHMLSSPVDSAFMYKWRFGKNRVREKQIGLFGVASRLNEREKRRGLSWALLCGCKWWYLVVCSSRAQLCPDVDWLVAQPEFDTLLKKKMSLPVTYLIFYNTEKNVKQVKHMHLEHSFSSFYPIDRMLFKKGQRKGK